MKPATLLAVLALVATTLPSAAQTTADVAVSSALTGEARALYDFGRERFAAGDFAAALAKFTRAHELSGDPRLIWNMAASEAALKHYARAMTLVDRYLASGGSLLSRSDHEQAERFRDAAGSLVGTVQLSVPEGTEIAVDGEAVGKAPLGGPLYLDAGKRRVVLTKPGYRGVVRREVIGAGTTVAWKVELERLRVEPLTR